MSIYRNACIWLFVMTMNCILVPTASAEYSSVGEMADGLKGEFQSLGQMTMYGIFFVGLCSAGFGLYQLSFGESRMGGSGAKIRAIVCIVVGAIMMTGSAGFNMFAGSMTGGEASGLGELGI